MKKIVIIEDNTVIQHLLSSWFIDDDYNVLFLSNLEGLTEKIEGMKPDLIITDIMLPNNTATDLIDTFCKIKYPIIVLSSMEKEDVVFFAFQIGAIAAFTKPVKMNEIVGFINEYFQGKPN